MKHAPRIVIIGGGFGGLYATLALEKKLSRLNQKAEISLVSKDNFFLFTPMLHEVASSSIALQNIVTPLRKIVRKATVITSKVTAIDRGSREITLESAAGTHHQLGYDYLVIAVGNTSNFYGIPGLEENAMTLKTLGDAITMRNSVISLLEKSEAECPDSDHAMPISVVIGGGGFAGTETVGAIHDLIIRSLPLYPKLRRAKVTVHLIEGGEKLLPELGSELGAYTAEALRNRSITLHLGWRISAATETTVTITQGETEKVVNHNLLIWTGGVAAHPLVNALEAPQEKGRVLVESTLHIPGDTSVWSLGDCAAVPQLGGGFCAPTAQHAIRQAETVAHNIVAEISHARLMPYTHRSIGALASIGERTGVARIFGFQFSGFIAWWMWRTVYLFKLPQWEKRIRVAIDWTSDLIFGRDIVQYLPDRSNTKGD
jgi:NADH:ubiquinone reductase (H+-translocating)